MTDKTFYIYKPKPTKAILQSIKPKEYKIKRNKVHRGLTYTKKDLPQSGSWFGMSPQNYGAIIANLKMHKRNNKKR